MKCPLFILLKLTSWTVVIKNKVGGGVSIRLRYGTLTMEESNPVCPGYTTDEFSISTMICGSSKSVLPSGMDLRTEFELSYSSITRMSIWTCSETDDEPVHLRWRRTTHSRNRNLSGCCRSNCRWYFIQTQPRMQRYCAEYLYPSVVLLRLAFY